ncbi:hypothetical protein [Pseudorhodoplanes sp.]|uniref:hypothetical protein n=1 Tax=Pseudorhodoplanes sp. TaxID=1934341 RepID=UPI00391AB712
MRNDSDRVPVWIVATPKYDYVPLPVEAQPRQRTPAVARGAMAGRGDGSRAGNRPDGLTAIDAAIGEQRRRAGPSLGFAPRRDNDPFHRD